MTDQADSLRAMVAREHHPLGPSSLGRVFHCPGSYALVNSLPPESRADAGKDAEEGTDLHARVVSRDLSGLDEETAAFVAACIEAVDACREGGSATQEVRVEYEIGGESLFGTADLVTDTCDGVWLHDWKFGRSEPDVDTISLQMMAYALPFLRRSQKVTAVVYYPRTKECISRTYTPADLEGDEGIEAAIGGVIAAAKAPNAPRNPGAWCSYCPALHACTEARREVVAFTESPLALLSQATPEERGRAYAMAKRAEDLAAAVKAECTRLAKEGMEVEGYRLVKRRGDLKVADATAASDAALIPENAFLGCVTVNAKALIEAVAKNYCETPEQAMERLRDVVTRGPNIEYLRATRKEITQ